MSLTPLLKGPQISEGDFSNPPHQTFSFPALNPRFPSTRQGFVTRSIWALVGPKTHLSTNNMPVALENPTPGLMGYG